MTAAAEVHARPFEVGNGFENLLTPRLGGGWMVKTPGDILFSVEAHGGMRLSEGVSTRDSEPPVGCEELRQILLGFQAEFIGRFGMPIEFFMGKVVPNNLYIPGLGTIAEEDNSPVSNFGIRVPLLAKIIRNFKTANPDWGSQLHELAKIIMEEVRTLDEHAGLKYSDESTSMKKWLPIDLAKGFYGIDKMNLDNIKAFRELCIRVLHPIPNEGEGLTETGRLKRDRLAFIYYGVFIIACNNGGLEPKCTLSDNHNSLSASDVEVGLGKVTYPRYQERQTLQEFNLIAFKNRRDVETRIGICNGFLNLDGTVITGKNVAWNAYKHELYGPIQILRRAIFKEQITHAELIVLVASLGNNKVLLIDSACNCIEDARNTPESLFDTPSGILDVEPITHEQIRDCNSDRFDELVKERDACREANKVLIQAREAKAEAEMAAMNAETAVTESMPPASHVVEATGAKLLVISYKNDIEGITRTLGRKPECLKKIEKEMIDVYKTTDELVLKAHNAEQKYQKAAAAAELQRQQAEAAELQRQHDEQQRQQRRQQAAAQRPTSSARKSHPTSSVTKTTPFFAIRNNTAVARHIARIKGTPSRGGNTKTPSRKQKRSRRQNPYRKTLKKKYTRKRQNRRNNHTRRRRH